MATWKIGDESESVAKIQRWLYTLHKRWPKVYPNPGTIDGRYSATTAAAVRAFQKQLKQTPTGNWNTHTAKAAEGFTAYITNKKHTNPFYADVNQGLAKDRAYIIAQYKYVYGRNPSLSELAHHTSVLQKGFARASWLKEFEKNNSTGTVKTFFKELLGREPTAAELTRYGGQIKSGAMNRAQLRSYLANTPEALLREKVEEPSEEQQDARDYINSMLDDIGLGELKDWAWEQILEGHSDVRIMQDLRQTDVYKQRFAGMALRQEANLPAMSEAEYLAYEESAAQLMRQYGMPATFWDQPADFASLIGANVSVAELGERVQDGYVKVSAAPAEVRDKFNEWFGVSGDAALASYFLDPEKATPVLQREIAAAEIGGIGTAFGYGFSKDRSMEIAGSGITGEAAREGMAQLDRLDPLFAETIDETLDMTAEDQGADAVFQLGQSDQLLRRASERTARTKGGGGAAVSSKGVGVGSAD